MHDLDYLGMDVLGGRGARGQRGVSPGGGALEQGLAHLRATGVVQADEQNGCHRSGSDRCRGALVVGHDDSAASAGVTSG